MKELAIGIKAIDQATSTVRGIGNEFVAMGSKAERSVHGMARGTDAVTSSLSGLKSLGMAALGGIAAAAAAAVAAISVSRMVETFKATADEIERIGESSDKYGLSIQFVSELGYAAKLAGKDMEGLAGGISTFEKNFSQFANTGKGKAADIFTRLGVETRTATGAMRSAEDALVDVMRRISEVKDEAAKVELAKRLFGDDQFLVFINEGVDALQARFAEARALGVSLTQEQKDAAMEFNDAVDRVGAAWDGVKRKIVADIAPEITGAINYIARTIAALPEIVRNVWDIVSRFLKGQLSAPELEKVARLGESLSRLVKQVVMTAFDVAGAVAYDGFRALTRVLLPVATAMMNDLVLGTFKSVWLKIVDFVTGAVGMIAKIAQYSGNSFVGAIGDELASMAAYANKFWNALPYDSVITAAGQIEWNEARESMKDAFKSGTATASAMQDAVTELGKAVKDAAVDADNLFGITKAIDKVQLPEIPKPPAGTRDTFLFPEAKGAGKNEKDGKLPKLMPSAIELTEMRMTVDDLVKTTWNWDNALTGVADGWARVKAEANNAYLFAERFVSGISFTLSAELGTAISDSIRGVKSFGDAFKEMGASVLQQISEMIFQMLALRAIVSIGNSFGLGGLFTSATTANPVINSSLTALGGPTFASGGYVNRYGAVERSSGGFAGGGMVSGYSLGRDSVAAMLMPGEGVLNRRAIANNGPGLVHALNAGAVVGGGGSGGVVNNITVNINAGSGTDPRAIERHAFEGVRRALDENPSNREWMRGRLQG